MNTTTKIGMLALALASAAHANTPAFLGQEIAEAGAPYPAEARFGLHGLTADEFPAFRNFVASAPGRSEVTNAAFGMAFRTQRHLLERASGRTGSAGLVQASKGLGKHTSAAEETALRLQMIEDAEHGSYSYQYQRDAESLLQVITARMLGMNDRQLVFCIDSIGQTRRRYIVIYAAQQDAEGDWKLSFYDPHRAKGRASNTLTLEDTEYGARLSVNGSWAAEVDAGAEGDDRFTHGNGTIAWLEASQLGLGDWSARRLLNIAASVGSGSSAPQGYDGPTHLGQAASMNPVNNALSSAGRTEPQALPHTSGAFDKVRTEWTWDYWRNGGMSNAE